MGSGDQSVKHYIKTAVVCNPAAVSLFPIFSGSLRPLLVPTSQCPTRFLCRSAVSGVIFVDNAPITMWRCELPSFPVWVRRKTDLDDASIAGDHIHPVACSLQIFQPRLLIGWLAASLTVRGDIVLLQVKVAWVVFVRK